MQGSNDAVYKGVEIAETAVVDHLESGVPAHDAVPVGVLRPLAARRRACRFQSRRAPDQVSRITLA